MSALSGSLVERSEHRILGDLGVMAVQVFSRIRLGSISSCEISTICMTLGMPIGMPIACPVRGTAILLDAIHHHH
jgi:hypothetical protein